MGKKNQIFQLIFFHSEAKLRIVNKQFSIFSLLSFPSICSDAQEVSLVGRTRIRRKGNWRWVLQLWIRESLNNDNLNFNS